MPKLSTFIKAERGKVFEILANYEGYADWTADVVESMVLAQEGDIVVAEFFSPELMEDKYTLELVHSKPASIVYQQVDQYGSRGLSGSWHLTESSGRKGTIVTGEMNLKVGFRKRLSASKNVNLILQRRFDALMQVFFDTSVDRPHLPVWANELANGEGDAEAVADEKEFAVWLFGHKYHVKKMR